MTSRIIWQHSARRDRVVAVISVAGAAAGCAIWASGQPLLGFGLAWWAFIVAFANQRPRIYARFRNGQFWLRLAAVALMAIPGFLWLRTETGLHSRAPDSRWILISAGAGVALGLAFTLIHLRDTRLLLSPLIIGVQPRMAPAGVVLRPLYVVLMVPLEELYYRALFVTELRRGLPIALAVAVSAALFVFADWASAWGPQPQRRRFAEEAGLGLVNAMLFVLTGSLAGPVLAHYIYNLPQIMLPIRNFAVHRRGGEAVLEAG
jgi:membrane protease YdiL (CAAX protease family)